MSDATPARPRHRPGNRAGNDGRGGGRDRGRPTPPPKPGLPVRIAAAKLLGAVIEAHTPLDALTDDAGGHPAYLALEPRDRALVRAILLAALRHRTRIEAVIAHRLERPLPGNARSLSHHLHVGATQVLLLDVPDRAAIDLAVEAATRDPRTRRFAGLVNALLRRLAREKERTLDWMERQPPGAPDWLEAALHAAYGAERTGAILAAHAREASLDLTVKDDPTRWADVLGGTVLPTGTVRVTRAPSPVPELPGFAEGAWWVQDAAAALPARLLGDVSGRDVLDLCAAPGGKTAQLACGGGRVRAVEINANRARRLAGNLERLGLEAEISRVDLLKPAGPAADPSVDPDKTPDGLAPAPLVLLDAPCSSTGTIRRHPDVAWTKTPDDVVKLAALQARLLARAAELTEPGGRLVFANCSLLPEEGEAVTAAFLAARDDFALDPVDWRELGADEATLAPMIAQGALRVTPDMLPHENPSLAGLDGFYAARFRRAG